MAEKKGLAAARAAIKKSKDLAQSLVQTSTKADNNIPVIKTGSFVINRLIGGGWPRGRIIEVYGPESSGKSTVAALACAQAQIEGGTAAYIDFEHAVHLGYISQGLGVDIDNEDRWLFAQPNTLEEGRDLANLLIDEGGVDVLVVDSITAMTPEKFFKEASSEVGLQARLIGQWMNSFSKRVANSGSVVILVNQVRSAIKTSMYDAGPDEVTSGGNSIKFYASLRIKLRPRMTETVELPNPITGVKEKTPVSNFVRTEIIKNKITGQRKRGEFCIRYGSGIDNARTVIDVAMNAGKIKKSGSFYTFEGDNPFKVQGLEKVRKQLLGNEALYRELFGYVTTYIDSINDVNKLEDVEFDDDAVEKKVVDLSTETEVRLAELDKEEDTEAAAQAIASVDEATIDEIVVAKKRSKK